MTQISRGEVWLVDLNPVRGHEQSGKRPCLIISVDLFNQGTAGLVVTQVASYKIRCFDPPPTPLKKGGTIFSPLFKGG